ncbi:MAG TPA: protein translocase subunit SecF [Candidatus Nitrosopolaris sp.]|nr:protein translocase subunit SecF [Candidatus Nitrosopolaris sp.]
MAMRSTGQPEKAAPVQHRFFEIIPPGTNIDFVGMRFRMLIMSWTLIAIGLVSIYLRGGLNYGIDFAGGTMVQVKFAQPMPVADIRGALSSGELREVVVQNVGQGETEFQIRVVGSPQSGSATVADSIKAGLKGRFGEGTYEVLRVETVGPKVGKNLWRDATLAVLAATLVMGAYIALRFELRFGIGAAVALVHDVLITLGALSIANMEFDLTTVAALLTVVGYSVHDTVIVSDRIRENMRKMRRDSLATIMNLSINETLSRTLITSGTAVLVTAALFFLGGPVIHSFAFALLVGFVVGTYSSIYVASPIVLYLEKRQVKRR